MKIERLLPIAIGRPFKNNKYLQMKRILILFHITVLGCASSSPIKTALNAKDGKIDKVMDDIAAYEVQILYSEVIRDANGKVSFKEDSFHVDDNNYFYPASTVKLPIAILTLEKINENNLIDRNTEFVVESDSIKTTFANEIIKIFAVSDNDAYNRLFEFLGKDYINKRLHDKGIASQIVHRLSVPNSAALTTKSLNFYKNDSLVFKTASIKNMSIEPLNLKNLKKGNGYMIGDSLVMQPMDFSSKNYLPISSLHNIMKQLLFPELYPKEKQFHLSEDDRQFLMHTMKILPKEAGYNSEDYYESYVKFLIFGDTKEPIPNHIKIYNKVGDAYGYLTDCAYIVNERTKREYLITATIHVNKNRIFNDDVYEYDTVGIPFLAELGRQLVIE